MVDTVKNSKLFWCVRKFSSYQFKVLVVKPKFVHNRVLSCHKFLDKSLPIPDETITFIKNKPWEQKSQMQGKYTRKLKRKKSTCFLCSVLDDLSEL